MEYVETAPALCQRMPAPYGTDKSLKPKKDGIKYFKILFSSLLFGMFMLVNTYINTYNY